eukprot:CAMPEP_0184486298 /NCGR_PEP_ID=MMETSP0113_2-20130426/7810_1 /TAXON_ID=91329 /ORGANISM="Norrisiella sphaerica, Strain BC52" /LENGTH=349 /DNA_ID=CAMNT_0026868107 /DNA_START=106 /DNA_END=1155 /DNA_ORIENTATION=-
MRFPVLLSLCLGVALAVANPIARHMVVEIIPATDKLIRLDVGGLTNEVFNCTIMSDPLSGTLYQLSDNYMNYQYSPWKGNAISAPETVRVNTNCTIVYSSPLDFQRTRFSYKVTAIISGSPVDSYTGYVDLLKTDRIMDYWNFTFNKESWKVQTAAEKDPCWSSTAITGSLNHYIYNCDLDKTLNQKNDVDWYFKPPMPLTRPNMANAFNGTLEFDLAGFEGYFTSEKLYETPRTFIYLGCSTCDSNAGYYIAQRNSTFDGSATHFSFRLNDDPYNGWRADPFDVELTEWPLTENCKIAEMLSNLDTIRIYADVSESEEIVGIDDVIFKAGPSTTYLPNSCYSDADMDN